MLYVSVAYLLFSVIGKNNTRDDYDYDVEGVEV